MHEILVQSGNLHIKSKGKVTSQDTISKLKQQGIQRLRIDQSKAFQPENDDTHEPLIQSQIEQPVKSVSVSFEDEIVRAQKLYADGRGIQKRLLSEVGRGLPIDIDIPRAFSQQLVASIHRNPNALMCISQLREKDAYLLEHSMNVAILLANFAKHLNLPEEQIMDLTYAGFLHDMGKIKVPDEILHKPGKLTDQEMNVMRDHVVFGMEALQNVAIPAHIIRTVGEHHERLDGHGYPEGKRGDEISQPGRMIAIVDTYDAITADRCYKAGLPSQRALQILLKDSPEKYDETLVQQFIKCVGIYPVGSLVLLSNEQLGMVIKQHEDTPLTPQIKVFYSVAGSYFIAPKDVDLARPGTKISIKKAIKAEDYGIDFHRYFKESIAV